MEKLICENKHYFRKDLFDICPICGSPGKPVSAVGREQIAEAQQERKTAVISIPAWQDNEEVENVAAQMPEVLGVNEKPPAKEYISTTTNGAAPSMGKQLGSLPVAWLVGLREPYQGAAFACVVGRNRIGREEKMEISIPLAQDVRDENHAEIIYEPNRREFFLQAGVGNGMTYHNGNLVFTHNMIQPYDRIGIGGMEFIFLPLCGERFSWDEI